MVRVYFNKRNATQESEVNVRSLVILCNMYSGVDKKATGDQKPYAWMYSTNAEFVVRNGIAIVGLPTYISSLRDNDRVKKGSQARP
jgi:hypothetical protein